MRDAAAIIGGGLGGLSAGIALAQKGASVILFEKEPRVGGYAVGYNRGGYTFDLALHVVAAGGPGGEFDRLVSALGIRNEVSFIRLKEGFRVVLGDYAFQMPNDKDELFARLRAEFPKERDHLHALRKDLEGRARVYAPVFDAAVPKWRSVPPFLPRLPSFLRHTVLDTKRYLGRFIQDRRLIAILFQPSALLGIPMSELPAVNFIMMFHILVGQGMYTIRGGGQALTAALENRFASLGGMILTRSEAGRIIVRDRMAVAVRTVARPGGQAGKEYPVSGVIAGVSPLILTQRLIAPEHFPASYMRALKALRPSMSVAAVNLGLDCHPREAGIANHMTLLIPEEDIDGGQRPRRGTCRLPGFAVTARGNTETDGPVSSAHTLSVVGLADMAQWQALAPDDYRRRKEEMTDDVLQRLERHYPGLRAHVRVRNAVTPMTLHRRTGNPNGAIFGFDCTCGKHRRIMRVRRLPLRNAFLAGAWTDRLGGFMQSIRAGIEAADGLARSLRM